MREMLGEDYFNQRLGDINGLSPVRYVCGRGTLAAENDVIPVEWELNCAVTGAVVLVLSSQVMLDINRMVNANGVFREWTLAGRSLDDCRELRGEGVIVPSIRFTVGQTPELPRYFCHYRSLDLSDDPARIATSITAYLSNFQFEGIDWSARDRGGVADSFTVNVAGRRVVFRQHEQLDHLKNLLGIDRIDRALLSTVTIPLHQGEAVADGLSILARLEWLTAFLSQNRTFSPAIRVNQDGESCGWIMPAVSLAPMVGRQLIDNHVVPAGLRTTIEAIYDQFGALDVPIDLKRFVDMVLVVAQQKHAEFKLSALILAFEYLCTKSLSHKPFQAAL
jgi:hypothetical protein